MVEVTAGMLKRLGKLNDLIKVDESEAFSPKQQVEDDEQVVEENVENTGTENEASQDENSTDEKPDGETNTEGNDQTESKVEDNNKEDVSVIYEDGYLVVEAKVSSEETHGITSNSYVRQERYSGSCSRSFYIGEIDESKITAKCHNGVLKVTFPDEENEKKTKIKKINIQ